MNTARIRIAFALLSLVPELSLAVPPAPKPQTRIIVEDSPAWRRHVIDGSSTGADGIKLGDMNHDGLLDLVTAWEEGGEVRAYLHPGTRPVRQPWPRVIVGKVRDGEDAIFTDLDNDGRLEVVSCTEGRTRTVFWHRFSGPTNALLNSGYWTTVAFPATQGSQMWMQAAVMDIDAQHGPDLVLAGKERGASIGWLKAPGNPENLAGWTFHPLREAGWVMSLCPSDVDGDGDTDIVFTDRKGARSGLYWLENPGAEATRTHQPWREHAIGAAGRHVMFSDFGDLNNDARIDMAVAVKPTDIVICLQRTAFDWTEHTLRLPGGEIGDAKAVKIVDVNQDGRPDLLFTCESARGNRAGVVWLEQQNDGSWKQRPLGGPAGVKFDLMQTVDLDADGDLDVITCEETEGLGVVWYENPMRRPAATSLPPAH